MFSDRQRWNPDGQHCYITGGSSGLGLALATLLVKQGADVSIVARTQSKLDDALAQLEGARRYSHQKLRAYAYSLHILDCVAFIVAPIWRWMEIDRRVKARETREEHARYLESIGFFDER
ncbi:Protein kinase domain-containing protein [Mycena kentingensis (nom. inval.)]|nr:Protein kinase domain-containing protein [Mycena kentingensis (nom. inval.)]